MSVKKSTNYGVINVTDEAIANLAGSALSECYGVVGMTSKNLLKDAYYEILKKENLAKGIEVKNKNGLEVDIYVILSYGIKISEVLIEAQKRLKYVIESNLDITVDAVNIYVQGVK